MKYKTDNLYLGLLGIVKEKDNGLQISSINKYIICRKETIDAGSIYKHDIAKDIFTDKKYYFFKN